jgi:hypothetical protein
MSKPRISNRKVKERVAPTALQFEIALEHVEPRIWRRIRVPVESTLWDLHVAIQDAMGWQDCHFHQFLVASAVSEAPITIGIPNDDDDISVYAGWEIPVALAFRAPGDKVFYNYDFGDDWMHAVVLEEIVTTGNEMERPTCIGGARACPPEDCGGPHMYTQLLQALIGRRKKGAQHELLSLLPRGFDPDRFDPKRVKFDDPIARLRNVLE